MIVIKENEFALIEDVYGTGISYNVYYKKVQDNRFGDWHFHKSAYTLATAENIYKVLSLKLEARLNK